jgi:hypothetical protein
MLHPTSPRHVFVTLVTASRDDRQHALAGVIRDMALIYYGGSSYRLLIAKSAPSVEEERAQPHHHRNVHVLGLRKGERTTAIVFESRFRLYS